MKGQGTSWDDITDFISVTGTGIYQMIPGKRRQSSLNNLKFNATNSSTVNKYVKFTRFDNHWEQVHHCERVLHC